MRLFEDFVPISDTEALITTGWRIDALDQVERAPYIVDHDGRLAVGASVEIVATGGYVRLGGLNGEPYWSDRARGIVHGDRVVDLPQGGHQPFVHDGSVYYTNDEPRQRIYRDGELFLGHFGSMIQVANPCLTPDGTMYFEARETTHPERPSMWQIWSLAPGAAEPRFHFYGANPAWWDDHLFYGVWNGRNFDYRRVPVPG